MLPENIQTSLESQLNDRIISKESVHGGDINQAHKLTFDSGTVAFLKWNEHAHKNMFKTEAKGLDLLRSAETNLFIPKTLAISEKYLLLEWVEEGGGKPDSSYNFGVELGKLHSKSHSSFGLDHDNFIGKLKQSNTNHSNWPDFFALQRVEPQVKLGIESGKLSRSLFRDVEQLYKKLGSIFPREEPALLHGDLWSGNFMFTRSGEASIYDPAVYFGHREMDLAMTRLFGGFSSDFYSRYNEQFPLEPGFEERVTLCNLYPILVHANLFGGSYCRQAENIVKNYV